MYWDTQKEKGKGKMKNLKSRYDTKLHWFLMHFPSLSVLLF